WQHTSARILQAQGDGSGAFAGMLKGVLPLLGDAAERIEREGASFLDVGVGVASIAIAVCRAYPRMRAVGLDVHEPALELARARRCRAAAHRIGAPRREASARPPRPAVAMGGPGAQRRVAAELANLHDALTAAAPVHSADVPILRAHPAHQ